jgi:hypothetical protein
LVSQAEDATWQAQALECDLLAIASTRAAALDTLVKIIQGHVAHDARQGRDPLSGFAEAPEHCWNAFNYTASIAAPVELAADTLGSELHFLVLNAVEAEPPRIS